MSVLAWFIFWQFVIGGLWSLLWRKEIGYSLRRGLLSIFLWQVGVGTWLVFGKNYILES